MNERKPLSAKITAEAIAMLSAVFPLILVGFGFIAGYVVRELISRKRRAAAREEWARRREQKNYDDRVAENDSAT